MFVGRLSHNKRQDRLVKALALHQRHCDPEARLVLPGSPGSGTYGEYLARLAVDAGARDVVLPGALPQPALNALYARADVFCCLSEHEGFCIPLLEALHFGLPVVAARAAAVPEVLGDAGVLLDDPDLPTVSEAIELCATSEALREELRTRGSGGWRSSRPSGRRPRSSGRSRRSRRPERRASRGSSGGVGRLEHAIACWERPELPM